MKNALCIMLALFFVMTSSACSQVKTPSDGEVMQAYTLATEASGWFRIASLPCGEPIIQHEGKTYYKVERYKSTSELKEYIRTLFSDELVNEFMSGENYSDVDGSLYTLDGARGGDITKGEETYSIVPKNDKRIVLEVTVELLDYDFKVSGSETHEFNYELKNGKWVFTSFPTIR